MYALRSKSEPLRDLHRSLVSESVRHYAPYRGKSRALDLGKPSYLGRERNLFRLVHGHDLPPLPSLPQLFAHTHTTSSWKLRAYQHQRPKCGV
jgi:hypothetical protein